MAVLQYSRAEDQAVIDVVSDTPDALDPTSLLGTWMNTNGASGGMAKVILTLKDGALTVRVIGADEPEPHDWGEITAAVYAKSVDSKDGMAFSATYDFGFMATHLQVNVKQGVLVIASFTRFKDDSGRANYFVREFFYQP
ncbi:hypothetical protein [Candidatus Entotheonella palauensis]|uniref:hypothetical protein n=1 Tax=Candidatus Entotheonella palauensis TaxID=93172 RepID=UPI000B7D5382|nr:hypothetical protein [Candidatus Entotheonella palauensis]